MSLFILHKGQCKNFDVLNGISLTKSEVKLGQSALRI